MAVSLSGLVTRSAKEWAAKDIAKLTEKEQKKEGIFGGIMSLLKPVAGIGSKALLGALGITSGGLLTPLLMGLGTAGISKLFEKGGRDIFNLGADSSKIEATGKYGFGKEEAKTIREGLEESIEERDPWSKESIIADVVGSYASALTPKIVPGKDGGFTVEGGELGENVMGAIKGEKGKLSLLGKEFSQKHFYPTMDKVGLSPESGEFLADPEAFFADLELSRSRETVPLFGSSSEALEETFDMPFEEMTGESDIASALYSPSEEWKEPPFLVGFDEPIQESLYGGVDPDPSGRRSPDIGWDEALYDYRALFEKMGIFPGAWEKDLNYKQGGKVPEYRGGGTITDYLSSKGKTLGGSNKQSLAEILGR